MPIGVPIFVPYHPIWGHDVVSSMEREKFIDVKLSKCMELWKQDMEQSTTYAMKMSMYLDYLKDVLLHLSKPLPTQGSTLLEGSWPCCESTL